jgi:choline kinase/phosphohistidine swiveling domain-containing protein
MTVKQLHKISHIVLGAGAPHIGKSPSVLREASFGKSVLEWIAEAYRVDLDDIIFVSGFNSSEIKARYPKLSMIENLDWKNTKSLSSLLLAELDGSHPIFVNYGDILFRNDIVSRMLSSNAPVTIAYDSHVSPGKSEGREKVAVSMGQALRIGRDVPVHFYSGEFIGLVKLSGEAVECLKEMERELDFALMHEMHLSDGIEYLRARGLRVDAIDVAGDWVEVREAHDLARYVVGTKAETLHRLQKLVKTAVIQDQVSFTVEDWARNGSKIIDDIHKKLRIPAGHKLIVRSSSKSEDTFQTSNAGGFESVLNVDPTSELESAIERVIGSYGSPSSDDQVLVQAMVNDVVLSGVIFTRTLEHLAPWYVVNYESNAQTDGITSGVSRDHRTFYIKRGISSSCIRDPKLASVLDVAKELEELLGYDCLDIEFAVNRGGQVFILQVRPIVKSKQLRGEVDQIVDHLLEKCRDIWNSRIVSPPPIPGCPEPIYGLMPDWNPAEIIGTAPGELARSLYKFLITDETWATQRAEYGYRDVRPNQLLVNFAGHPYVDVRASFASFIPKDIDDALASRILVFCLNWLRDNPTSHDKVEFDVIPTCLTPDFQIWENRFLEDGKFSEEDINKIRAGLYTVTCGAFSRVESDNSNINLLLERHNEAMTLVSDPLNRAFILLDDCRRLGTLAFAHLARSAFIAVNMLRGAERIGAISSQAVNDFLSSIRTVSHQFSEDGQRVAAGQLNWKFFERKYGHLRPGTYDICSPRYDSNPDAFMKPMIKLDQASISVSEESNAWKAEKREFFKSISQLNFPVDENSLENFIRKSIEGREYAKFVFSRSLSDAIEAIAEFGETLGLDRDTLSNIPLPDLLFLMHAPLPPDKYVQNLMSIANENRSIRSVSASFKLPPLIRNVDDFNFFEIGSEVPNFVGQSGVISEIVNLEDSSIDSTFLVSGKIALIPQADPGFDFLFSYGISGLITMYGGANSHMAIRAAEFGLPAAIGVGEKKYENLRRGEIVEIDPKNRILRVIK